MAVTHRVHTQEVADILVDALGSDPIVEAVYLQVDDRIGVWVLVKPVSMEDQHHLYATASDLMRRYVDSLPIDFRVINPRHFLDDIDLANDVIPRSAKPIELHPSA